MKAGHGPDQSGEETGMNAAESNEATRDEERMMALLALTSQELPAAGKGSQREALHDYLDANPAAFEQFLKKHRDQPPAQKTWRSWFGALQLRPMRYALAIGIASLCAILIARPFLDEGGALVAGLDAGYAELATHADAASLEQLSLAADRDAQFGFSPQPADSQRVESFVAGLAGGEQRLSSARKALPTASSRLLEDDESRYYALGEWNVLLSAAAHVESGLPATFWQSQLEFHGRLSEALADDRDSDPMIAAHMRRTGEHLSRLSRQSDSRRTAHELSEELRLFRGHLAE